MRQYKYRGKRIDNGEWIVDSETIIRDGDGICLIDDNLELHRIQEKTLGMFIGFYDHNNTPIYEDDVVGYASTPRLEYKEDDTNNRYVVKYVGATYRGVGKHYLHSLYFYNIKNFKYKILGNIHDNIR